MRGNWFDRALGFVAPGLALSRMRARIAADVLVRHYEAASKGRRTAGWRQSLGDANAVAAPAISRLRYAARDLVRNNGHAESALRAITNHVVGWGIVGKPAEKNPSALSAWKAWAESTDCDADGRKNLYGIQRLVMRTVVESGECLVRRRFRRVEDGLSIPMQLQVIDPDYIDTTKTERLPNLGRIVNGVEFNAIGQRVAYWLFRDHPGSQLLTSSQSYRIPAENFAHIYREDRPGQVRGVSWFAPVLLKFKDFDDYDDATLMKQKVAACLAVLVTDPDGSGAGLGTVDGARSPEWDSLEPGSITNLPMGRTVTVVDPPTVREYSDYARTNLRTIAAGLGVPYEDMTGDYANMPFSAARMSRLRHWDDVEEWRWQMLIPQFCDPVWRWFTEAAAIMGQIGREDIAARWTPPPAQMIDPASEADAYRSKIRAGLQTLPEALRELGYDPDEVMDEYAASNKKLDDLGIVLDSDPRKTSNAGLTQARPGGTVIPSPDVSDGTVPSKPQPIDDGEDQ